MKKCLVALFLLIASTASAQISNTICDQSAQVNPTIPGPNVIVGFCWSQKNTDGSTTIVTGMSLQLDGPSVVNTSSLPVLAGPSASGLYYYQFSGIPITPGSHTITITISNANGSTTGSPFVFSVATATSTAKPSAPFAILVK